jgi:hypothetical protein
MTGRSLGAVEAKRLFDEACAPLFAMQWEEFDGGTIDPEVAGLRFPQRFSEAAFRLVRKLHDADISPDEFLQRSLSGAAEFYAKPPNFADPKLLCATKHAYHDSLHVGAAELQRQYRREIDLAKILAKLYGTYLELLASAGHTRAPAKDLPPDAPAREPRPAPNVGTFRAQTQREEASFIAERVRGWIDDGTPLERIAILLRSVACVEPYERALLDREIPVAIAGDVNIWRDRRVLDALALLWNVVDPFRHDWLLRTLGGPAVGLSDASLAVLCSEPPSPQVPLFVVEDEPAPATRAGRWDPKRDLRLGWNVVRGDQDMALSEDARARLLRFRRLREGWLDALHGQPFERFVRLVWQQGLAREGPPTSARARTQQLLLGRALERMCGIIASSPHATPMEALHDAQRRRDSHFEYDDAVAPSGFLRILSVEAAREVEFDHAIVAGVQPGSFPQFYAPDAFLFSRALGMIPKENAGDASASRTAKYSYYVHRVNAQKAFYERERKAFEYALSLARTSVVVTASGPPTRGVTAPEFAEELRHAFARNSA